MLSNAADWAKELGVPFEAVELYLGSEVIDLHIDSFIWQRTFGYQLTEYHAPRLLNGVFWGQVDLPRLQKAGIGAATWVITTNPLRPIEERGAILAENLAALQSTLDSYPGVSVVQNLAEYRRARAQSKHAAFLGIQGGNALPNAPEVLDRVAGDRLFRVTLLHLSRSGLGRPSVPLWSRPDGGLTRQGVALVRYLDQKRILVDLAHISPRGFWDAVKAHDSSLPLAVTHTGVNGVFRHWRNLDDDQIRAIAQSGGVVGIMYHAPFLGDSIWRGKAETIVHHLEHVIRIAGEDHAALGSDWDGAIITPRDMPTCLELPRLVALMLTRGWPHSRVQKVLGLNFLRMLEQLRG